MRLTPEVIRSAQSYLNPLKQRELNLRGLAVAAIENLGVTGDIYEAIDFSDNEIIRFENFPRLPHLTTILASNNRISKIAPGLGANLPALDSLVLANNALATAVDLTPLGEFRALTSLVILGNPVASSVKNIRIVLAALVPSLRVIDATPLSGDERKQAAAVAAKLARGASIAAFALVEGGVTAESADAAAAAAAAASVPGAGVEIKLTEEQVVKLMMRIEAASTMQEADVLQEILLTGVFPPGFDLG